LNVTPPVVVIDGDGALMMKMGTLATVGAYAPQNLIHIVLDNGTYDSTGGQPTVSPHVDFASAAIASGYVRGYRCDDLAGFGDVYVDAQATNGPSLIHMKILPGSMKDLGRPTISPAEVAQRFRAFLTNHRHDGVPR
jgi:phosphonopyruvate decarboxylase